MTDHFDVLIVGAGVAGIGVAYHLQQRLPAYSYTILESRGSSGGTWDLFRYPGIRSDIDMYSFGYRFKPWLDDKAIADGATILSYVRETAAENGIDHHIRYHHRVERVDWRSDESRWDIAVHRTDTGETSHISAGFVWVCTGYYSYEHGYTPDFPGVERFRGPVVHPQHWPEDLDCTDKRVVIIGSGATAVTLAPALAEQGAHVSVLQRSPSYVISMPVRDPLVHRLRGRLPDEVVHRVARMKSIGFQTALFQVAQRYPGLVKRRIKAMQRRWLPAGYDVDTHFTPRYDPWDQRLCLAANGDFFRAIRRGQIEMVTDRIATFTESGISLESGRHLDADIVITATGLNLVVFGGARIAIDGKDVELPSRMGYKAMMLSDVPNLAFVVGYTNAAWTLKVDLVGDHICRLLAYMDARGYRTVVPVRDPTVAETPFLDFTPNYVLRSIDSLPKQGSRAPWRLRMNYLYDLVQLRYGRVADPALRFS